jgi:hypothetical protein
LAKRELKVFSMSFLDLLCCGLGAVILLNLLMIVSIRRQAAGSIEHTYFIFDADIWIPITDGSAISKSLSLPKLEDPNASNNSQRFKQYSNTLFQLVKADDASIDSAKFDTFKFEDQFPTTLTVFYRPTKTTLAPKSFQFRDSGSVQIQSTDIQFNRIEPSMGSFYVWKSGAHNGFKWYYRIQLQCWALHTPEGIYSFELAFNGDQTGNNQLAARTDVTDILSRIELQASGIGGHQLLQTHESFPMDREIFMTKNQIDQANSSWLSLKRVPTNEETLVNLARSRVPFIVNHTAKVEGQPQIDFRLSRTTGSPKFGLIVSESDQELLDATGIVFPFARFDHLSDKEGMRFFPATYVTAGRK